MSGDEGIAARRGQSQVRRPCQGPTRDWGCILDKREEKQLDR